MKHEIQFVTNCGAAFWLISLLLLQTDYSRQAAAGPSGSSPPVTTPRTSSSTIAIAPRLSPSPGNWVNVTSNLAGMTSECGNMTFVSAKPNEDLMIAGVARRGLWGSRDGGMSWHQLGSGSATIINRTGSIIYDPARPEVFWESGIYNSNGVYRTDDNGNVFRALGSARHNDSVSVDFTDRNRRTLLAGGHEQKQTVYRSQDGGSTWINVGVNLPAGTAFSSYPLVVNSRIFSPAAFQAGAAERVVFIKATTQGRHGVPFQPKAAARSHLLQATDLFTGQVEMARWCGEPTMHRIGYGNKPLQAAPL